MYMQFDIDTSSKACRIAFFGSVISACAPNEFDKVSIFKVTFNCCDHDDIQVVCMLLVYIYLHFI